MIHSIELVDTIDNIANLFGHECNFLAKSISFWGINNGPTKDEYIENEALDLTGAELIVYYDDNTNEIIPITAEMIEDIDEVTKTAGFYWVTVNFNGESNSFRIDINHNFVVQNGKKVCTGCGAEQPLVTSVVCTQEPTRTYYKQDNLFRNIGLVGSDAEWRLFPCDFSGCKLTVNFGDNTSKEINCDNDLWYDDDTYTIFGFFEDTGEALYSSYDGKMYPREGNPNYYCFSFDSTSESTVDVYFDYIGESYKLYTINYVDTNVKSFSLNIEPSVIAYETFDIPSFYRMREIAQGTDDVVLSDYVYTYTANRMPEESGTVVEIEVDYGGYGVGYEYVTYYDADEFEAEAAKHFSITTEEMRAKLGTSIEDAKESRFCDSRVYFDEERDAYGFYYGVGRDDTGVNLERYGYVAKENNQFELYFEEKEITGDSETIPEEGVAGYDYIEYYNPLAEKTMYYLVSHTPYLIKLEKNGNDIKFISVEQIEAYPSDNQNLITYPSKADYIEKLIGATFTIYNYDNTRQDIVVTEDTICRPTVNFGGDSVCLSDHDTNWLIKLTDNFYAEIDYAENAVNRLGSVRFMNIVKSLADSHVHTWDDGVVTTEPTCTAEGVKTYTCTDCGAVKTEAVAALGHSYKNVTTKATLTANGSIKKTCSRCGDVASTTTIYMASKVTASASSFTYNGKVQKPTITVKDSKGNAIASSNYTLAWSNSNSKAVGTYTVKVTFKGNYSGTKTFTYKILPRQVGGLKFKSATTSSVTITWTKLTEAKYYKVEYSTNGKTWKTAITVATNSATVKNLSAGTKYQFRVTALDSTKKITGKVSSVLKNGTLCAKPTLSSVKSTTAGQATATWKKTTGASKYIVYKSTDKKKWTKVTTTTKLTYTLKGLTKGKKIYVKIVAINAYSKSSADSAVKYTTVKK